MVLTSKIAINYLRLIIIEIVVIMIFIKTSYSLRCRTDDGPSDGELKRVARSCMRKFGDAAFAQSSQQQQQFSHYQQQQHQQSQGRHGQRVTNRENYGYNYDDSEDSDDDDFDDDQNYNSNNSNNKYNQRQQYGNSHNNNNNERNERGDSSSGGHNNDRSRYNNNNNNNNNHNHNNQNRTASGNGNSYNGWNYSNQRNSMGNNRGSNNSSNYNNNSNNRNKNNNSNNNQNSTSLSDAACIVHCFFADMHMLNNNDYPDRHKMLYILTKDVRDRELRNFYTDTIQECFRYLENQRRREKCQFSRDLISCMTEYAKGNCDDWNEFNMMFN